MSSNIVITGVGALASNGNDTASFWEALLQGKDGYSDSYKYLPEDFPFKVYGKLKEFDPSLYMSEEEYSKLDLSAQFAVAAATLAIEDSKLDLNTVDKTRVSVVLGTTCGANQSIEKNDFQNKWFNDAPVNAINYKSYNHASIPNAVSQKFDLKGQSYLVGTACASGSHSIGEAVDMIRLGAADVVICGGSEAVSLLPLLGFNASHALSKEKCSPFDKNRSGVIQGEGAGILILESQEHAEARNARMLGKIPGWSANCDADNISMPVRDGSRCAQLIESCLSNANVAKEDVDYISVHGTGTKYNDQTEVNGIKKAFGQVYKKPYVSSIKSMIGHTFGAAGALEAVISVLAINQSKLPPSINLNEPDEEFDLNFITEKDFSSDVNNILSMSFGFGGCNVALMISKCN